MATKKTKRKASALTTAERKLLTKLAKKAGLNVGPRIEVPRVSRGTKRITNTSRRHFWTDGTNAYLRRKKANPAICERTDEKVRKGEYKHVRTSDDVEIYEIAEDSPLRRRQLAVNEMSDKSLETAIVRAACKEDWRLYYDAVSELGYRFKNSPLPAGTAHLQYQTQMRYIEHRILRRGGPSPMMIQHQLAAIRKERTGTRIHLPH